jgi:hypothetical protein
MANILHIDASPIVHADNLASEENVRLKSIANGRSLLKKIASEW